MRVQCDVCEMAEAAVMCCADEAALCVECDLQVHAANKLAIKHQRVPLIKSSDARPCDICQEKTGYFFCLQDRALLCRNCDVSIHTANTLSSCHQRFLVTGIRAALEALSAQEPSVGSSEGSLKSATSTLSPAPITNVPKGFRPDLAKLNFKEFASTFVKSVPSNSFSGLVSTSTTSSALSSFASTATPQSSISAMASMSASPSSAPAPMQMMQFPVAPSHSEYGNMYKRSSISEYLTEGIPGWRVDELLNLPELAGGYTMGDVASSKADAVNLGDFDWMTDLSLFDEQVCAEAFHEVPELLSLGAYGFPQSGRLMTSTIRGKAMQDVGALPEFEDAFTVPDLRLRSLPNSSPLVKRRRL